MDEREDIDRAAILARRQRFIAIALAGISGLAYASEASAEAPATESAALGRELDPACVLPGDDLPPLPAPAPPPETLTDAERYELARRRYEQAKWVHDAGSYEDVIVELEAAYALTPDKHGLAFYIGAMAHYVGRWRMARAYLQHFLAHADAQKFPGFVRDAERILAEIDAHGCDTVPIEEEWTGPEVCLSIRAPGEAKKTACERRRERNAERRAQRRAERRRRRAEQ